ncbi:SDR family NAD(P)-dependent oxidoreductase [Candidatus Micrarchaeota archaeon]|nr:SDR family NAD(P)-dependent oxidoreductase [Candidatus Micrarchaeota archaeon]
MFRNKKILITGGTGTIGKELIRELLKQEPDVIRIYSRDETKQYLMENSEFADHNERLRYLIGDIRDRKRLAIGMEEIDIVFHTAALKHVKSSEYNPFEAVKTNILGTQNVIETALEKNVEKVLFTSSDKAVNPTNVMGISKLMAERLITSAEYYKGRKQTIFSSVRFGNVFGSRGSVVSLWKGQMKKGYITMTKPDMTRYMMTSGKAIELILKACELSIGGEIFVFKMPSVRLSDLAVALIDRFGENKQIEVKEIGLKDGEKEYEELMTEEERSRALEIGEMYVLLPQIKELFRSKHSNYLKLGAKQIEKKKYSSTDEKMLSKDEIIKMFLKE